MVKTIIGGVVVAVASGIILHFVLPDDEPSDSPARTTSTREHGPIDESRSPSNTGTSEEELAMLEKKDALEREQLEIVKERAKLLRARSSPAEPLPERQHTRVPNMSGSYSDQTGAQYRVEHSGDRIRIVQLMYGVPVFELIGTLDGNQATLTSPQLNVLLVSVCCDVA